MRVAILIVFLIGYVPAIHAETAVPETRINHAWVQGLYWNPGLLPGWGFFVDVQEETFFGAVYGYDGSDSTFITMQGTRTRLDPLQFQGDVFFVTQGGGAITDVGNFTWEAAYYEATPAARLSISSNILNRSDLNLIRFVYKEIDNVDILTGAEWCTAEDLGEWFSEHYDITDERTIYDGNTYAIVDDMHPLDFGPGLVAYFPPEEGDMFAMMIPYDDTYTSFYVFLATDSGMYGRYWLLDEGESPQDSGYFFRGSIIQMQAANDSSGAVTSEKYDEPGSQILGEASQGAITKSDGGTPKLWQIEQGAPMATALFASEYVSAAFDRLSEVYDLQVKPSRALD